MKSRHSHISLRGNRLNWPAASAWCALPLLCAGLSHAQIVSDFDDSVYPGAAGNGWAAGWTNSGAGAPEIISASPIDAGTPYLHVDFVDIGNRNVVRHYESGAGVDVSQAHKLAWKFRLDEDPVDFEANFTTFNDRVHFFGRNAARLGGGTDAAMSWAVYAVGAAHSSGAGAGKTFWVYDNLDGSSGFNLNNNLDTGIALVPGHVYSFELVIDPGNQVYTVSILDEQTEEAFVSEAPHKFRDLSATTTSHTFPHFGVAQATASLPRAYDLDSVVISTAEPPGLPPEIVILTPLDQSVHRAEEGIRFQALSESPLPSGAIQLILNGEDVSGALSVTGDPMARSVVYEGLVPDRAYTAEIHVTNPAGTTSRTIVFNTATTPLVIVDTEGFEDNGLYPPGDLGPVTDDGGTWDPATEPAQIVDLADGVHGKVLRREQLSPPSGNSDLLNFTPYAGGVLRIAFDARVSTPTQRTLDLFLQPATAAGQASMLGWGINAGKVSFFDGAAWVALLDLDTDWHHYEMVSYLSGPLRETFDLVYDGSVAAQGLVWRNSYTPGTLFGQIRIGAIRGSVGEYGDIDNLVVSVEPTPVPPPEILNLVPAHRAHFHPASAGLSFEATSEDPIPETGIHLTLNGEDVSAALVIGGSETNRSVSFNGLQPDTVYFAEIRVANTRAEQTLNIQFNTISQTTVIFDAEGFSSTTLYPPGPLGSVTHGLGVWIPGRDGDPAQIVESGDPGHGQVLRRAQTGTPSLDLLDFTPFNSGILTVTFDARVSTSQARTFDLSLNRTGQDFQASSLTWGANPGQVSYVDLPDTIAVAPLDEVWHQYQMVNYLDGPASRTFDLVIDGEVVGRNLAWAQGFAAGEFFGRLRIASLEGLLDAYGDIDNLVITLAPPLPAITNLRPQNLATFYDAAQGLSFQASSGAPIATEGIEVIVNSVDVSGSLVISGPETNRLVVYNGLTPNTFYSATIRVGNARGQAVVSIQFDTFNQANAVTIEAEDYNYESGQFQDDPPPSGYTPGGAQINGNGVGYLDLEGTVGVDYAAATGPTVFDELYRFLDNTTTQYTLDGLRQKYIDTGAPDYELIEMDAGDWQNYTRTFPTGQYRAFLRAQASSAQAVQLALVTSDRTAPSQMTTPLGTFQVPDTAGYAYVPLTDGGAPVLLDLDGVTTLRLTELEANDKLQLNFLLFLVDQPAVVTLLNPQWAAGVFSFEFATEAGRNYTVEATASLQPASWGVVTTLVGDGSVRLVSDSPGVNRRIYRVIAE